MSEVVIKARSYGNAAHPLTVGDIAYDGDLIVRPNVEGAPTFYLDVKQAKRLRAALAEYILDHG